MEDTTQIQQRLSLLTKDTPISFEKPRYDEVELDLEETEEALRQARETKFFKLQREEYNRKLNQVIEYTKIPAEGLFEKYAEQFKFVNDQHKAKVKNLCCYFAGDSRSSYDLTKGLLMMGPIGNGKTTLMKFFSANQNHSFRVVSMLDISFDYKNNGEAGVSSYAANFKTPPNMFGGTMAGYCFDDVGTEEIPARHYGESKNIFAEILQVRYAGQHIIPFNSTHVTTNKNSEELLNLYGSRCYDRMKEMFNVVTLEHESFRGQ